MLRLVRTFTAALAALNAVQAEVESIKSEFKSLQAVFQKNDNCTVNSEKAVTISGIKASTDCNRKPDSEIIDPDFECPRLEKPISLYFMIDSSDSVTDTTWKNMLTFVHHVVTDTLLSQKIEAKQEKIFVMVAQFSSYTKVEWANFYSESNKDDFKQMLE